jgi:hypothetical protein
MKRWLAGALLLISVRAAADSGRFLRERFTFEWIAAAGGWRTALGSDLRAPGAEALGGGTEVMFALDFYGPLGVAFDGRFLGGLAKPASSDAYEQRFFEGLGGVGLQLHVSETVRLRAGAAAGQLITGDLTGVLVGGWLAASIDLFAIGGRLSMALSVRLDADAVLDAPVELPSSSLALAAGLGIRY